MTTKPLGVRCPNCGSANVVYTCDPECCFNHACGECMTSFLLSTNDTGRKYREVIDFHQGEPGAPTVACANCGSLRVAIVEDFDSDASSVVCVDCFSHLRLEITGYSTLP